MGESEIPIDPTVAMGERREMPRCTVDVSLTLVVLNRGTIVVGRMTELSLSGCRVLLPKTLSHSTSAAVECTFKIRGVGFRLGGIVEWAESNLVGVKFNNMSSRSRDDLMEVLCEVELENNARLLAQSNLGAEAQAAEAPVIEMILAEAGARNPAHPRPNAGGWNPFAGMAFGATQRKEPDLNPETPRMRVVPGAASAAPARGAEAVFSPAPVPARQLPAASNQYTTQATTQPNRGRDRRAAHRCGVDTSAVIDLIKVGSKIAGQIVDLSVGGCRIKTTEKFPVGIYTRIETEFKLHGLPFRLGGVIQAIHDRNTVGIRFLDMSPRKKDQVAELVSEMEEPQGG
jgi:c-di-GMP-binding flagellar brake protein YcgR